MAARMKPVNHLLLGIALTLTVSPLFAGTRFHSLEDIRSTAKQFAISNFVDADSDSEIEIGYLDSRLKLNHCDHPLTAEPLSQRNQNTNFTITVRCSGSKPWSVYVPVKIRTYISVLVSKRPLARGIKVTADDFAMEKLEISKLRNGYFTSSENLIGRIPKRSLPKGKVVSPNDLETYKIINRGSKVSIMAQLQGINVRMPGRALSDGAKGEMIKVENLSSKRVIEAVAIKPGIVQVPM